jgi:hypothetical protein
MAQMVRCGNSECGLEIDVTIPRIQGLPIAAAQKEIGPLSVNDVGRCQFGKPSKCPHFEQAINAAIAAGRLPE